MHRFQSIAVVLTLTGLNSLPAVAQTTHLDELFQQLQAPEQEHSDQLEAEIFNEWSKSGSSAMDLLLLRGRKAMEEGDFQTAIDFFTALTDHAPDFAEGWNARATAYFHAGLYGPSVADIERVLALNPRHFGAISGLAMILEELGRDQDALDAWHEVEELTPHKQSVKDNIKRLEVKIGGQTL